MPLVKVDMRIGQSADYKKAIVKSIHQALMDVFKTKESDNMVRIGEYEGDHFYTAEYMSAKAVFIEMIVFPGRTKETKKQLFKVIVDNLSEKPGIDPKDVLIVLQEPSKDNWGIRGGQQASAIELGFKTDV